RAEYSVLRCSRGPQTPVWSGGSGGVDRIVDARNKIGPVAVGVAMTHHAPAVERIGIGVVLMLAALTAIGPLTIDLYLAAFPDIVSELDTTQAKVQLTM